MPVNKAKEFSKRFYGIADRFTSENLKLQLRQAEIELDDIEYMSIVVFSSLFMFIIVFSMIFILGIIVAQPLTAFLISICISGILFFVTFVYLRAYPKLLIKKRVADIERNLIFALRHLYVQIKSGVSLFDAMVSVSKSSYGLISKEFKRIVKEVNAGKPVGECLEDLALKNPSVYFRRSIWQISNGMKAGSDLGNILNNIINHISAEQKIEIRKYGSKLSPLTVVYMMIAIIIPSLGITFLIVLSTFSGISISEKIFLFILGFLTLFQFMFLGLIKSRRPNIV